jgi:hypothetical protein
LVLYSDPKKEEKIMLSIKEGTRTFGTNAAGGTPNSPLGSDYLLLEKEKVS